MSKHTRAVKQRQQNQRRRTAGPSASQLSAVAQTTALAVTPQLAMVAWSAPLFDPSGYADEARGFVTGLDSIGVPLRAQPINWTNRQAQLDAQEVATLERLLQAPLGPDFVHVEHIFPTMFQRDPNAIATVGRTMFETDRVPAGWVERCNALDEIWVPSDFNLKTFAEAGIDPRKLHKLPGSLDARRFRSSLAPLPLGADARAYRFLSVFDWSLRKGWDVLYARIWKNLPRMKKSASS